MLFAWNVKKNKAGSIKNLEREQNRANKDNRNKQIDPSRSHLNYDLVAGSARLQEKTRRNVEKARANGSRIRTDSVVNVSSIITVPRLEAEKMGEERTRAYFESTVEYFQREFGKENVTSAIVHLDESAPHMHLHFTPVNVSNGKLQAHKVMTRSQIIKMHKEIPEFLREKGFDVQQGSDGRAKDYTADIHELKRRTMLEIDEISEDLDKLKNEHASILDKNASLRAENEIMIEVSRKEKEALRKAEKEREAYEREINELYRQKMDLETELEQRRFHARENFVEKEKISIRGTHETTLTGKKTGRVILSEDEFKSIFSQLKTARDYIDRHEYEKGYAERLVETFKQQRDEKFKLNSSLSEVNGELMRENSALRNENDVLKVKNDRYRKRLNELEPKKNIRRQNYEFER